MRRWAMTSAAWSECKQFRYTLTRFSDISLFADSKLPPRRYLFVMNNPSTADEQRDDPTIARVWRGCVRWTAVTERICLVICNTNPHRSTDPALAIIPPEAILEVNDEKLALEARDAHVIVCAWGALANQGLAWRALSILRTAGKDLHVLGVTKEGSPRHPLYLPNETTLRVWAPEEYCV